MKPYIRHLTFLGISFLLLIPKKISLACGPWPAPPEEFRLSLFQPNIGDEDNEFASYYFSTDRYFKNEDVTDFAVQIETDQNYNEWGKELKKEISKKDFYKAVQTYTYQVIADSSNELAKSNSFIKAITAKVNKDYFEYFKLAKSSEMYNSVDASQDPWDLTKPASAQPLRLVKRLEDILQNTRNVFIQQRVAYILCRLFFYQKNVKDFKRVYDHYLGKANTQSWVKASAAYYAILINTAVPKRAYYQGLINVIDYSKDKRMACIKLLNEDTIKNVLPYLETPHQKAVALSAGAIRYPAYSLEQIKRIYSLDPGNKFIPLLVSREINKLEDWLLTPALTEYAQPASDHLDNYDEKVSRGQNLKKDIEYAEKVKVFLTDLSGSQSEFKLDFTMALCHLNLLLKDNLAAAQCCDRVMAQARPNSGIFFQAKINSVVIAFQQAKKMDDVLKERIYNLLKDIEKAAKEKNDQQILDYGFYNQYTDIRDALLVYLGRSALKQGDIANACLLLSGTFKPWGEYRTGYTKSAYFILYEHAKEDDFDQLLTILRKPKKTNFEKYFCSVKGLFDCNYSISENNFSSYARYGTVGFYWNVNKVLDLKGTYFVVRDSLQKAAEAFRQVPAKFWADSENVYHDNLTGDPFKLNIYDTHEINADSLFKDDPDKSHFIDKLINYKMREAKEQNLEVKAKLNYIIGNAYYSMSYFGKFWLMSRLWWGIGEREEWQYYRLQKPSIYDEVYYGASRAKTFYQKAFSLTKNKEKAAFYCMYLTACENNRRSYKAYAKQAKIKDGDYFTYKENKLIYTSLLKQKTGSDEIYQRLIKECPLYSDFRNKF